MSRTPLPAILLVFILAAGWSAGAQDLVRQAERNREAARALLKKGREEIAEDRYYEALHYLESAMVAEPANVEALSDLGLVNQRIGDIDGALKYYRIALSLDPGHLPSLARQGMAFLERGQRDEAQENINEIGMLCGKSCPEYQTLTQALQEKSGALEAPDGSD